MVSSVTETCADIIVVVFATRMYQTFPLHHYVLTPVFFASPYHFLRTLLPSCSLLSCKDAINRPAVCVIIIS